MTTIILTIAASFICGLFSGWFLRTYWFVKDRDCADPSHYRNTLIEEGEL